MFIVQPSVSSFHPHHLWCQNVTLESWWQTPAQPYDWNLWLIRLKQLAFSAGHSITNKFCDILPFQVCQVFTCPCIAGPLIANLNWNVKYAQRNLCIALTAHCAINCKQGKGCLDRGFMTAMLYTWLLPNCTIRLCLSRYIRLQTYADSFW